MESQKLITILILMNLVNVSTEQQKTQSLSGEKEKAEIPDGHIEHSNADQIRNSFYDGTVDEVIELSLHNDLLPQGPDNHSDEGMWQPPKRAKTRGVFRNRTGSVLLLYCDFIL